MSTLSPLTKTMNTTTQIISVKTEYKTCATTNVATDTKTPTTMIETSIENIMTTLSSI